MYVTVVFGYYSCNILFLGGNDIHLLQPAPDSSQGVARVPSAYIRQMAEEKLLIPGRSLALMDTIGQGIHYMLPHLEHEA